MSKFLVTGSAGFIASRVVALLLKAGHTVVGLDNRNDAYDVELKDWRTAQLTQYENYQFLEADVADWEAMQVVFQTAEKSGQMFDGVFHLAARAGVRYSVENPWVYMQTNCSGTLNILELVRRSGIDKLVFASSSSVYGNVDETEELAFREDWNTDHPCSPYAASKKATEAFAYSYHHLYHTNIAALRFFTVYGPAGRPDMSVLRFIYAIAEGKPLQLFGDGTQSRDFTYVDDIADGVIRSLDANGFHVFNFGGDHPHTINSLIEMIAQRLGREPIIRTFPPHAADVKKTWADISQARTLLGWSPKTSLEEGLQKTIDWYLENRDWVRELKSLN